MARRWRQDVVRDSPVGGKNRTADRINKAALSRLPGKEFQYYAECTGQVSEQDKLVPDLIRLKNGAHVIMVQNSEKYRNGSSGRLCLRA